MSGLAAQIHGSYSSSQNVSEMITQNEFHLFAALADSIPDPFMQFNSPPHPKAHPLELAKTHFDSKVCFANKFLLQSNGYTEQEQAIYAKAMEYFKVKSELSDLLQAPIPVTSVDIQSPPPPMPVPIKHPILNSPQSLSLQNQESFNPTMIEAISPRLDDEYSRTNAESPSDPLSMHSSATTAQRVSFLPSSNITSLATVHPPIDINFTTSQNLNSSSHQKSYNLFEVEVLKTILRIDLKKKHPKTAFKSMLTARRDKTKLVTLDLLLKLKDPELEQLILTSLNKARNDLKKNNLAYLRKILTNNEIQSLIESLEKKVFSLDSLDTRILKIFLENKRLLGGSTLLSEKLIQGKSIDYLNRRILLLNSALRVEKKLEFPDLQSDFNISELLDLHGIIAKRNLDFCESQIKKIKHILSFGSVNSLKTFLRPALYLKVLASSFNNFIELKDLLTSPELDKLKRYLISENLFNRVGFVLSRQ